MNGENKICRCFPSLFFVSDQDINSLNSLLRFFFYFGFKSSAFHREHVFLLCCTYCLAY